MKLYLRLIASVTILSTIAVVAALFLTNPSSIGPAGVTLWFVGVFLALSGALTLTLNYLKTQLQLHPTPNRRLLFAWRQGSLMGLAATIWLALSSLRQLSWGDVALLVLLLVLVEFYLRARS